mmetsp:Transcript_18036/g.72263  ORF Transcript_18036/g.72263 Transcript_18036/m.72263 type:complete len:379 (+) Transcript_18036:176-1312(+)
MTTWPMTRREATDESLAPSARAWMLLRPWAPTAGARGGSSSTSPTATASQASAAAQGPDQQREQKPTTSSWPTLAHARTAATHGLVSGSAGASAMLVQVALLMPLDTLLNVQYRFGQSTLVAARSLYAHGYGRFYCGVLPALFQGPAARFGDTATNATVLTLLNSAETTEKAPTVVKTLAASSIAALWRVFLMPADVCKTVWQIYGERGVEKLAARARRDGLGGFYYGSAAAFTSALGGHLPWYTVFNELDRTLPSRDLKPHERLLRHAFCGFAASFVSDSLTNALRVLKAIRQSEGVPYAVAVRNVLEEDGLVGLLTRGLKTRLIANGVQGVLFTVLWKSFEGLFVATREQRAAAAAADPRRSSSPQHDATGARPPR